MKTKYLFIFLLFSVFGTAQVLYSENFESYNMESMDTQSPQPQVPNPPIVDGYLIEYGYASVVSDFQIVSINSSYGKSLQIKSVSYNNSDWPDRSFSVQPRLNKFWNTRTSGNNIMKVTYDFYTGNLLTPSPVRSLLGVSGDVGLFYDVNSQKFMVRASFVDANGAGISQFIPISSSPSLPANTWVSLGYTFNYDTREFTYTINGTTSSWNPAADVSPQNTVFFNSSIGSDVFPYNNTQFSIETFFNKIGNWINNQNTFAIDNLVVEAVATLSTSDIETDSAEISISPNPTKGIFSVNSKNKGDIVIYNTLGQFLKKETLKTGNNKIDISSYPNGVYLLKKENKTYKLIKE